MFFYKKFTIILFLVIFITPFPVSAGTTCSIGGLGGGAVSGILSSVTGTAVPVNDSIGNENLIISTIKECVLDGLTVLLRETLIENLTGGILDWVNTGFDGNAAFVTDVGEELLDAADKAAGEFIEGSALGGLCNELEVRVLISESYYSEFEDRTTCTLTEVVDNIDSFTSGDFGSGGWNGWWRLTDENIYRELLSADREIKNVVDGAVLEKRDEINRNAGFSDEKECSDEEGGDCETVTPGSVIAEQTNNTISGPLRQLELADELDEIINQLLSQLSSKVLGGGGLSGLSKSGGGKSSYTTNLSSSEKKGNLDSVRTDTLSYIQSIEATENIYRSTKIETKEILEISEELLIDLITCNSSLTAPSTETIEGIIIPLQITVQEDIDSSQLILVQLSNLKTTVLESNSSTRMQDVILEIEDMGTHSYIDITRARTEQDDMNSQMSVIDTETEANLLLCQQ